MPRSLAESIMVCVSLVACVGCAEGRERGRESHPELLAVEELRIGSVDDPETSLTRIRALEIGPDGRIYTLHRREYGVRIHAPDGMPLGAFGSKGEGPGEFLEPVSMDLAEGKIWVVDFRTLRVSYFDLDGVFLRAQPLRRQDSGHPLWIPPRPTRVLRDGTSFGEPFRRETAEAIDIAASPVLQLTADGSIIDTIAMRSLFNHDLVTHFGEEPNFEAQPFGDYPFYAVSSRRMELVMVDRTIRPGAPVFAVTKLRIGADTLWHREYGFDPIALTSETIDTFIVRRAGEHVRGFASSLREAEAGLRAALFSPEHLSAAYAARIGHDGSVWIALHDLDSVSTRWLVLRSDGEVLGELALPERFNLLQPTEDVVWGVYLDELDIPYIVKYSVHPGT